jgi:NADH-quinone oxidoreductase subunit M
LFGAAWTAAAKNPAVARRRAIAAMSIALFAVGCVWATVEFGRHGIVRTRFEIPWPEQTTFLVDSLNAPLIAATAFIHLFVIVRTPRAKYHRFSFAGALLFEALMFATLASVSPLATATLTVIGIAGPLLTLVRERQPLRLYLLHAVTASFLLLLGAIMTAASNSWGIVVFALGAMIVAGIFPFHLWATDLFERGSSGAILLALAPMPATYAVCRFVLPSASDSLLQALQLMALATALYAAGLGLVQHDARRYFGCLFLSLQALVLSGVFAATPLGLCGALCLWLSSSLALAGLGLTLRSLELRHGRIHLVRHLGLFRSTPFLASSFLLTGLACVGFPGTLNYIALELVQNAALEQRKSMGVLAVVAVALNAISILRVYFLIFAGPPRETLLENISPVRERIGGMAFVGIVALAGFFAQPMVEGRLSAAEKMLEERASKSVNAERK